MTYRLTIRASADQEPWETIARGTLTDAGTVNLQEVEAGWEIPEDFLSALKRHFRETKQSEGTWEQRVGDTRYRIDLTIADS